MPFCQKKKKNELFYPKSQGIIKCSGTFLKSSLIYCGKYGLSVCTVSYYSIAYLIYLML